MAAPEGITVAVAMSGGVDSSVTAALLLQQGYRVIGITMRLFTPRTSGPGTAAHDAAQVAVHLGIEHHLVDFSPDFDRLIISDFISEYRSGHTPNPCVRCNRFIKFGRLLDTARSLGAAYLATGHYVRRTVAADNSCHLRMASCLRKDQSYFLNALTQEQLKHCLFPLGDMPDKDEVRRLAREFGIQVAEKGDSQEICFIPNDDYVAFLEGCGAVTCSGGEVVHVDGTVIGRHRGIHRYTIGQRKGLGIAWRAPLFVVDIDAGKNRLIVGEAADVLAVGLRAEQVSWINPPTGAEFSSTCKIRYRHAPVACRVSLLPDARCEVRFDMPQKSVTPGQSVVFYDGDEVLGGARIVGPLQT